MGRTAARAVGYAEVLALVRGETDERGARDAVVANTRRLARKQMTWFGRDPRIHWLDARDPDLVTRALEVVAAVDAGATHADHPDGRGGPGGRGRRRSLGS